MSTFTTEPQELAAAYRPLKFTYEATTSASVEAVKVEVVVAGTVRATYYKPYSEKSGNDYTFNIDAQSPVQRYLGPRTDYIAAGTIFPALSGYTITNANDYYANYAVRTYLLYRNANGLLETSGSSAVSSTRYAFPARRPASDITLTDYYQQSTAAPFKWLTDGPTAQEIGYDEAAAMCLARKGVQYIILKFYDANGLSSSATTNTFSSGPNPTMLSIDCGPANLEGESGMPADFETLTYYTIEMGESDGTAYTQTHRFDLVKRCAHAKRLYWMNSLGGVDQYTFEGQIVKTHRHGGELGEINQQTPTDSDLEGVIKTGITSQVRYNFREIVDQSTAEWLRNLFISPEVYLELDGSLWLVTVEPGENEIDTSNEAQQEIEFSVLFQNEITQEI